MAKIRAALRAVAEKLVSDQTLLERARKRYKAQHKIAVENHRRQVKFQESADLASGKKAGGYPNAANAERFTKAAARCAHRAYKAHLRAQFWLGRIKPLVQRIEGLEVDHRKIEAEIAKWQKEHGAHVDGNEVKGGTPKQRFLLECLTSVANASKGLRTAFYSMEGIWDILHELVGGPKYGHRSDCSSTVTGWIRGAGLPDINGTNFTGGYTGTFLQQNNGWKIVSEAEMRRRGWGVIVYLRYHGDTIGHHTEAFTPSKANPNRTCGHGSAPVDFGTVDLFGDGLYACLVLDQK